jgi:hypothetical protein
MNFFYLILLFVTTTFAASPVFLSGSGAKICTLNNVGSLPAKGSSRVKHPVYQKVCRQVVPTALGDQVEDDDNDEEGAALKKEDKNKVSQLRRAIIQQA